MENANDTLLRSRMLAISARCVQILLVVKGYHLHKLKVSTLVQTDAESVTVTDCDPVNYR